MLCGTRDLCCACDTQLPALLLLLSCWCCCCSHADADAAVACADRRWRYLQILGPCLLLWRMHNPRKELAAASRTTYLPL